MFLILFIVSCLIQEFGCQNIDMLTKLSLEDRIKFYGYPVEIHKIITQDGYILSLYRVPGKKKFKNETLQKQDSSKPKSVVLLLHGMAGSPGNYFLMGRNSLALYLVDRGFDVWALCSRGLMCSHSPNHKYLDYSSDQSYWNYTLHEIAINDVPPAIDYVLNKTGHSQLFMLGHSAGTTMQFMLLSELPEYNDKIKISASLAPTVYIGLNDYPLLRFVSFWVKLLKSIYFKYLGSMEIIPSGLIEGLWRVIKQLCFDPYLAKACVKFFSLAGTQRSVLLDSDKFMPLIVADVSYRISAMQVFHYADMVNSGNFMRYDYGKKNLKMYGQSTPPVYNLTKITCPVALFYAQHDSTVSLRAVKKLRNQLQNVIMNYKVPFKRFTHTDFVYGNNASKLVYNAVVKLLTDFDEGIISSQGGIIENKT